jgi:hypothetical protein
MAMFSFVTIFTATNLDIQSNSYIDNREFPGVCVLPLGPLRYQSLTYSGAIVVCRSLMFLLNSWLADGLLVSFVLNSTDQVSYAGRPRSFIVSTLSIP